MPFIYKYQKINRVNDQTFRFELYFDSYKSFTDTNIFMEQETAKYKTKNLPNMLTKSSNNFKRISCGKQRNVVNFNILIKLYC